jgi:hypothetical protein
MTRINGFPELAFPRVAGIRAIGYPNESILKLRAI